MNADLAPPTVARAGARGRPVVVIGTLLLVVALVTFVWLSPSPIGLRIASWALALFAALGVFAILLGVLGLLRVASGPEVATVGETIAESSEDSIVATDRRGAIIFANAAYRRLCGGAPHLRTVDRLFAGSPEVSESVYRLAQAAHARQAAHEDLRVASSGEGGQSSVWYRVRVAPLGDGDSERTVWTVADVTRERERHETFFQDLQRAIDYLDHAPAGFFSSEANGSIVHINATLAQWLNYDLAKFRAGGLGLADIVSPESLFQIELPKAKPGEIVTVPFDVDLKPRGGRLLSVRILHRVAFSAEGEPGASRSLVLRRDAGVATLDPASGESRFARIFYSTPMGIAIVDKAGQAIRWNPAFARLSPPSFKTAGASARPSILSVVGDRDRPALQAAIAAASEGHEGVEPVDATLEDDAKRSARFYVSATETQGDEDSAATVFALDTTEQRTLQENLVQSQKMQAIGQLAGGIAHDFNNVLTAIIGYSDLLLANHRPTDPSFQDIMQIKQNANRAAGLVRQLLAFSRRQTLRPQVLQLGEVLADLQILLNRLVGETIKLEVVHGRDLWLVKADQNQFEQVIVNLVVNARDAIRDGGEITVRTRNVPERDCAAFNEQALTPADYVLIEVQDTGHGIAPDVRAKIFEPFFTTKEVGKGTGLGLSMVYGIVKQTGGFVFVESEQGKGATFRVFLPRHERAEAEEAAKKDAPKSTIDLTGRGAILLVEDEEAVRAFASRALTSRGYTVLQADSGLDALRVVEEANGAIDLIVSDVIMPEMDGPSMLSELRRRGIRAKVVFVSGYADDALSKNLPEGQEYTFLPKPFTLKQLIETVKTAMTA